MNGHETKLKMKRKREREKKRKFANMQTAFLLHSINLIHMFNVACSMFYMFKMKYNTELCYAMLCATCSPHLLLGLHFHIFIPMQYMFRCFVNEIGKRFQYTSENILYAMDHANRVHRKRINPI